MPLVRRISLRDGYAAKLRKAGQKPPQMKRTPLRAASPGKRKASAEYDRTAARFKAAHPFCQACQRFGRRDRFRTQDVHHMRGRAGSLLTDTRFFLAVCRPCHDQIHEDPKTARHLGLTAPPWEWNVPLPDGKPEQPEELHDKENRE